MKIKKTGVHVFALAIVILSIVSVTAWAQVSPIGAHDTAVGPLTGQSSSVSATGGLQAAIPIDLPSPRGTLGLPVSLLYTGSGRAGAVGIGWDMPLSYVHRSISSWHRKPAASSNDVGSQVVPERLTVTVDGRSLQFVPGAEAGTYIPYGADEYMELRDVDGQLRLYTARGHEYRFTSASSLGLVVDNYWFLTEIYDRVGTDRVVLRYQSRPCGGFDLAGLSYGYAENNVALYDVTFTYAPMLVTTETDHRSTTCDWESGGDAMVTGKTDYDGVVVSRAQALASIDVRARNNLVATSALRTIRAYTLTYAADPDIGTPRLSSVTMSGEQGTSAVLPVAEYRYGSLTIFDSANDSATIAFGNPFTIPLAVDAPIALGRSDVDVEWPGIGDDEVRVENVRTRNVIRDFTGDGVPDHVYRVGERWHLHRGVVTNEGVSFNGESTSWTRGCP